MERGVLLIHCFFNHTIMEAILFLGFVGILFSGRINW